MYALIVGGCKRLMIMRIDHREAFVRTHKFQQFVTGIDTVFDQVVCFICVWYAVLYCICMRGLEMCGCATVCVFVHRSWHG